MSSLSNTQPALIPSDTIIPLHSRDDTYQNRRVSVEFSMRFDATLSAQKLSSALWTVLERPGWRKLGARLRLNEHTGKLEYHVPAEYTKERPPINFSHVEHDMCIGEHEIGATMPRARDDGGEGVQVFDGLYALREITQAKGATLVLADWIYSDKAQLGLHVVSFRDATLVTITWLHTLLDAMGRQALLRAWQAVLAGREEDIPEFWGYDFDPLERLGALQGNDANLSGEELKKMQTEKHIPAPSTELPDYDGRILCVPAKYLARLRTQALRDLESLDSKEVTYNTSNAQDAKPFLSDGDILCAWLTRLIVTSNAALLSSLLRPIIVINVLGLRDVLSTVSGNYDILIPKDKAYIGNATSGIVSPFSVGQLVDTPLGHVAAKLRKDLVAQSGREAVEASLRAQKQSQDSTKGKEKVDEMSPSVFVMSNWAKARLFETDFSAAIVGEAGATSSGKGKPSYIHVWGTDVRGATGTGVGNVIGKDGKGNYWIGALMPKEDVEVFEKALEQFL